MRDPGSEYLLNTMAVLWLVHAATALAPTQAPTADLLSSLRRLAPGLAVRLLQSMSSSPVVEVEPQSDGAVDAAELRRIVQVCSDSRTPVVLRSGGGVLHDDLVALGWDGLEEHGHGPLPVENVKVASGATDGWAGLTQLGANEMDEQPRTVAGFARATRERSAVGASPTAPYSLFDVPLRTVCPQYYELLGRASLAAVFGGLDGFYPVDGFPRLYMHPAGAISAAHIDAHGSCFWLRLLRGEKLVRVWPAGTPAREARSTPHEEFTLGAGDIFFGPGGNLHEVLTTQPSFAVSTNYFPTSSLHSAAMRGDAEVAAELLAQAERGGSSDGGGGAGAGGGGGGGGADEGGGGGVAAAAELVAALDLDGFSALHFAARFGHTAVLEQLLRPLQHGEGATAVAATVAAEGATAAAAATVAATSVLEIAAPAADGGFTPLHYAAYHGHHEACALLLARGARRDSRDASGGTPLHHAADNGHAACVSALLTSAGQAAAATVTPGQAAAATGTPGDGSGPADGPLRYADLLDGRGASALQLAASGGHAGVAEALCFEGGADVDAAARANGATPLHTASYAGRAAVVRVLLRAGAATGAPAANGASALHLAAHRGAAEAVEALLEGGAAADALDRRGATPAQLAASAGHEELALRLGLSDALVER